MDSMDALAGDLGRILSRLRFFESSMPAQWHQRELRSIQRLVGAARVRAEALANSMLDDVPASEEDEP